jgi:hypothetical protein
MNAFSWLFHVTVVTLIVYSMRLYIVSKSKHKYVLFLLGCLLSISYIFVLLVSRYHIALVI